MNGTPRLWVVTVNFNGLEDTRNCLRSLESVADPRPAVVVVDNASRADPVPALRAEFPWCHVVRNAVNGGWAGGNNTGIVYALERGADQVLLLNNDTTVAPRLAAALLAAARSHPDYGVLGPVIYSMDEPSEVMTDGCVFNLRGYPGFFHHKPVPLTAPVPSLSGEGEGTGAAPAVTEVDIVNGCAMMVARKVFARVGLIDERFFLVHEESDLCLRSRRAGFRCGVLGEGLVWHKGSSSFRRSGSCRQRYYDARNLYLLLRKHAAAGGPQRGPWLSRLHYLKYVYYCYAVEREDGRPEAAEAVLEGLADALAGRYGAYAAAAARPALPLLRGVFDFLFRHRSRRAARREGETGAPALR